MYNFFQQSNFLSLFFERPLKYSSGGVILDFDGYIWVFLTKTHPLKEHEIYFLSKASILIGL